MPVFSFSLDLRGVQRGGDTTINMFNNISLAAERAQRSLSGVGRGAESSVAGIKKLASEVLALVGAYKTLETATAFLQRGIDFTSSMETSRIGIASIVSTMTEIRDAQGNVLEGQQKYNAALDISAKMMERIQILGLETTATSQELVQGVQSIIAPALQAGMKLEEMPDFAVQAAQAMQSMGIPLQQMRTEIEAMLTGNINKAQDLLAPRLGLNAQDIRSWKEQGVLVERLMARLKMFEIAGKDVAQTWQGIKSNFSEAIDIVSGQISSGLTENLKQAVTEMQKLMISTDGKIGISDDFINVKNTLQELSTMLGEEIQSGVHALVEQVKELNGALANVDIRTVFSDGAQSIKEIAGALAGAMLAYKVYTAVVKSAAVSSLQAFRADAQSMGVRQALREHILATNAAIYKKIQAERQDAQNTLRAARASVQSATAANRAAQAKKQAALSALQKARAEEAEAAAAGRNVGITAQQEAAFRRLVAAERAYTVTSGEATAASNALATSQGVLAAATTRAAAATRGATALKTAWTGLKSAFTGLVGLLGGPVGAALTVAGGAALYLATRQTEAEQAAKLHEQALRSLERATKGAAQEQQNLADKTSEAAKALRDIAAEKATAALKKQINTISDALEPFGQRMIEMGDVEISVGDANVRALLDMLEGVQEGTTSVEDFKNAAAAMRNNLKAAGQEGSALGRVLTGLLNEPIANLEKYAQTAQKAAFENSEMGQTAMRVANAVMQVADAANGAATAVGNLNTAMDGFDPNKLKNALQSADWKILKDSLKGEQLERANLYQSAGLSPDQVRGKLAQKTGRITEEELAIQKRAEALNEITLRKQAEKDAKKSGRGASRIENARRSLETLRAEISKLNGESSAADVTFTKKFNEIERIGKEAKLSGDKIAELKTEYANAFKANTLNEFNKEVLQLEGNTAALRDIEIGEKIKQWELRFRDAGISAKDAEPHISRLKAALEKEANFKDVQTAVNFYKELGDLSGDYTLSIEKQNQLIALQAEIHRQNGIPPDLVAEWELLQKINQARDPLSGLQRGMRKTASEASNMAATMENAWTSMSQGMEDAIVKWGTTSKFTIEDVGNTMLEMIWRIAAQNIVTGPMNSIFGSLLGGFMGGGGYLNAAQGLVGMIPGLHSGGMARESPAFIRPMPLSTFEDAPRYHSGRLPWNPATEMPAVIRRDEAVLTPGQMRTIAGTGRQAPEVTINVYENTNKARAEVTQTPTANGTRIDVTILDVVNRDIARGGRTDRTMQTVYGLKRKA